MSANVSAASFTQMEYWQRHQEVIGNVISIIGNTTHSLTNAGVAILNKNGHWSSTVLAETNPTLSGYMQKLYGYKDEMKSLEEQLENLHAKIKEINDYVEFVKVVCEK